MECLLPYLCMVTVPHIMIGLERMLDYRGVGLERFHCTYMYIKYMHFIYLRGVTECVVLYTYVYAQSDVPTSSTFVVMNNQKHVPPVHVV